MAKTVYKLFLQIIGEVVLRTKEDDTTTRYCGTLVPKVIGKDDEQYL